MSELENINENISFDVQKKLHLLFCNTNIGEKVEKEIVDIVNNVFNEGMKHHRNDIVDSVTEK